MEKAKKQQIKDILSIIKYIILVKIKNILLLKLLLRSIFK